jgi:hypothetical protein
VIDDTPEHRRLRGHRVTVHEHADGTITIRHAGRVLPHRAHAKDTARITQGAVVEHKRLATALQWIAERQRARDLQRDGLGETAERLTAPELLSIDPMTSFHFPVLLGPPGADVVVLNPGPLYRQPECERKLRAIVGLNPPDAERRGAHQLVEKREAAPLV